MTHITPIPAKVLTAAKQSSQFRVLVQIELDKYLGLFHTLRFGERKPFTGSCYRGQLDPFYYRGPGLKAGEPFPLLDDYVTRVMQSPQNESQRRESLRYAPVRQRPYVNEL